MTVAPFSIPSPPIEWQIPIRIPLGEWLPFLGTGTVINIHTYALSIIVGIIVATVLTDRRLRARGAEPGAVVDILIFAVPLGIIGARIWHVATHPTDFFYEGADLWKVIAIWDGGGAIFGSLLFGGIGAWIGCQVSGIRFLSFADALAPGLLLAQGIGRLGNYFNHEIFGLPTSLPWGLEIPATNPAFPVGLPEGTLFHPTFLYEMLWNFVGAALIILIGRKLRLQWGKGFALYLIWYGVGRSIFENIRLDPSEIVLGLRVNVWGALLAIVIGLLILVIQSVRHTGAEPSVYRPGREWLPPRAEVDSEDIYTDDDTDESAEPLPVSIKS